jgi:stage II sporulation protein D
MIKKVLLWIILIIFTVIVIPLLIILNVLPPENDNTQKIKVLFEEENIIKTMPLDEYIVGVVCAEMPASFEYEALKAQAVASRTYTVKKLQNISAHDDADICTSSLHCQAYIDKENATRKWGNDSKKNYKKIKNAVYETTGEIITYNGKAINAVFHASNSGKTENSHDVWQSDVPYLKSVKSYGEELAKNYKSSEKININEFKNKLQIENIDNHIFKKTLTDGGSVKEITIGNKKFKGTEIRKLFNLKSANFDITFDNNVVIFNVTGHGHGVGMSQYGANAMAKMGKNYKEILSNYYTDTDISTYIKP